MLELVIIALIAVEVVIVSFRESFRIFVTLTACQALILDGPALWHMIRGTGNGEKKGVGEVDI